MTVALILALIGLWLIAAISIGEIERDADLAGAMTRLRLQRRRELREALEDGRRAQHRNPRR